MVRRGMPRCFPDAPDFVDGRTAEQCTWQALRDQLPPEAALFHSVALLERDREQEIDLLVAWPGVGLAVLEVKGGHVTRDAQGWWQESAGQRRQIGSPVLQAQDAKKVLTRLLGARTSSVAGVRAAHLVAVPFTSVAATWSSPDLPRACLLDRGDLPRAAQLVRAAVEEHGAGHRPLTALELEAVVTVLAGETGGQTALLAQAEEHEQRVDRMTRDQASVLRCLRQWPRIKVIGGAGTGKTFLALEQARSRARAGERVALLCYSRGLARYLERTTRAWSPRERPAYVGLFHQLPVDWGAAPPTEDSDDFEDRLPRELGELALGRSDLFDSVVVDEAQDFGALWWPSLLACLRDPVRGGLFVFLDEAQRVFAREGEAPIDLPPYELHQNIRNTKQIAQLFSSMAGGTTPKGMDGPRVRLVDCPPDEVMGCADDAVDALLGEGWQPGHIALLATGPRHGLQREAVDAGGYAAYWDEFLAEREVFYGHVLGFKGLERPVVVLAVNGFRDLARAREMLYVGLSRARTLLVLVGERALVEQVGGRGVAKRLEAAQAWRP